MGVYEDMANDAGYPFGTDGNQQMAAMIEEQEYNAIMESQYHDEMEWEYQHYEEIRREILFRKFTNADNKALHSTPKAEPKCTCHPHDLVYYGCRCK